jgi:hypothetical protein
VFLSTDDQQIGISLDATPQRRSTDRCGNLDQIRPAFKQPLVIPGMRSFGVALTTPR